uniref:Uncharacterized protein n=1 Tax=Oryza punctata TaxID=4537 RepID=A0A0E0LI36_ORYPU
MASSVRRFSPQWQSIRVCFAHRFPTLTTSPTSTLKPNGQCAGIGDASRFVLARAKDFKDSGKSKQETEWACMFFMWETQYEQLLKDMQAGNRQAGRVVLNHDGGKPWMGSVVPDFRAGERVLVYLGVLQALLLLLILVVVIMRRRAAPTGYILARCPCTFHSVNSVTH